MIGMIFQKAFGTHNERQLRRFSPLVKAINAFEPALQKLSDAELQAKTPYFKNLLKNGKTLEDILPEAFAVVREASRRVTTMRHFDVQLVGGIALHRGMISEMATGEGKTLVATLPCYLNALEGKGVHVVTVNDYLAKRDREWMGPIYEFLGLTVGVIQHSTPPRERKSEYACDITFGTNNEYGFDYLRDNMVVHESQMVQRDLHYAIVDEVDSILIDEARTPLIISGPSDESVDKYYQIDRLMSRLEEADYQIEEKTKTVALQDSGVHKAESFLGVTNLYDPQNVELVHHVNQALRAHKLFKKDVDYVVQNNEVMIVDEFTGRLMPGRRFSDGLHQALEAKENVKIERENQTLASVTFQNYFRMYKKLAGMTGTALTEAQEFMQIYKLAVLTVPTNKICVRKDHPDLIFKSQKEKFDAVVQSIAELHRKGQPVLVGTISIEKSEMLSSLLRRVNIPHTVLNAKYHEKEAEIIKNAGQKFSVTIATNMAGRGTDIVLGEGVKELGGLHVLGTERHEARRIDNQLRGRSARQGDPGASQFFISLEDDLMRIFGPGADRISRFMTRFGFEEGQSIQSGLLTKSIESAQGRVEGHNFDIRKQLLKYDDIMNNQRLAIYGERKKILKGEQVSDYYVNSIDEVAEDAAQGFEKAMQVVSDEKALEQKKSVLDYIKSVFHFDVGDLNDQDAASFKEKLTQKIKGIYESKKNEVGLQMWQNLERMILLEVMDAKWKDHLRHMDELREGIHLRAYAQKDPLVEYQHEGYAMFEEMTRRIKEDSLSFILRVQPVERTMAQAQTPPKEEPLSSKLQFLHPSSAPLSAIVASKPPSPQNNVSNAPLSLRASQASVHPSKHVGTPGDVSPKQGDSSSRQPIGDVPSAKADAAGRGTSPGTKVGRNDACPCGSGKKYKKCCGE